MGLPELPKKQFKNAYNKAAKISYPEDDLGFAENLARYICDEYKTIGMEFSHKFITSLVLRIVSKDDKGALLRNFENCYQEFNKVASETRSQIERTIIIESSKERRGEDTVLAELTNPNTESKIELPNTQTKYERIKIINDQFGLPIGEFEKIHAGIKGNGINYVIALTDVIVEVFAEIGLLLSWNDVKDILSAIVTDKNNGGWKIITDAKKCKKKLYDTLEKSIIQ